MLTIDQLSFWPKKNKCFFYLESCQVFREIEGKRFFYCKGKTSWFFLRDSIKRESRHGFSSTNLRDTSGNLSARRRLAYFEFESGRNRRRIIELLIKAPDDFLKHKKRKGKRCLSVNGFLK